MPSRTIFYVIRGENGLARLRTKGKTLMLEKALLKFLNLRNRFLLSSFSRVRLEFQGIPIKLSRMEPRKTEWDVF